ncbi:hypothetical protein LH427_04855 [Laribacter hongkongensis]|uniref:hypothetical protein n=1 Tax=Laribacter hongkongensis TaxID=168471 RepID=UPI001EFCB678|nr:hypothetical protein [Laribacter hongkongensis]MCG8991476.1 hypothetical protein [Laribacter hongkongensis]MCG8997732.1 hypothetical protein [Laribacter hongkongensis]MCG9001242.1 hypothetical protein [Laribacter hongkongensis]MCG9003062.1 hypothetical protein [Laribacter hongkongensis]MCG9007450.1 hypothetical protein [Laribacter hongkongensis]
MGAVLQMVSEPPLEADGITVLSAQLLQRLAVMNRAARALREMGYRIVEEEPTPVRGARPVIKIERGTQQSIGPLLDRSKGRQWRNECGRKHGFTDFMDVTVTWEEA